MSSEATTEIGGEKRSAWTYRIMFLSEDIEFKNFYCPYCEIPLHSRNINTKEPIVKTPHFYCRGNSHLNECNGEAIYQDRSIKSLESVKNLTPSRDMYFPEVLVSRPPQREQVQNRSVGVRQPASLLDVRERRIAAGRGGRAKATSYLMRAFVEAKNIVIRHAYNLYPEKSQLEARKKAIKEALIAMPLKLDDMTNYQCGFQTLAYPSRNRRIYHGSAKVLSADGRFHLYGNSPQITTKSDIEFSIFIPSNLLLNSSPKYHQEIIDFLSESASLGHEIRFHCFGMAVKVDDQKVEMRITSLDYIYLV